MLRSVLYRPEALLAATFAVLIVVGTVVLWLPASDARGSVGFVDAWFTATSAVCVTGLTTRDTATDFTRLGQGTILILIQLGGLGIMTFGALAAQLLRLRLSFSSHAAWQSAFFDARARGDVRRALGKIVVLVVLCEAVGAVLLRAGWQGREGAGEWFEAVFLAVSAFCNAGFSVYSDSVAGLADSAATMVTLMGLIVAGGLGYAVLLEAMGRAWSGARRRRHHPVGWSLQSRVILWSSGLLIVGGSVTLFVAGMGAGVETVGARAGHALFQSVSARTAGFNSIDIGALSTPALLLIVGLMFVGGSPGSCAGGIKTTTFVVWLARVRARLTGRAAVTLAQRTIPADVVRRAALVIAVAALWNLVGILVLAVTEGGRPSIRFEHLIFEQISAFGTVGLSAGLTPTLSLAGKLWIMATMFVGRLGPLTIAFAVVVPPRTTFTWPAERVMIG